jgi:hypothetical protein
MKTLKISAVIFFMALLNIISVKAQNRPLTASINKVIDNYLALKNALINADGTAAENKAKNLLASINDVPQNNMPAAQLSLWTKYAAKLQYDSRHISEVDRVPHQREHFASLSNNLFAVLKGFKLNQKDLYREYCVMTSNYYISEIPKGKDPYMGMANCSKVKETLPAVK